MTQVWSEGEIKLFFFFLKEDFFKVFFLEKGCEEKSVSKRGLKNEELP